MYRPSINHRFLVNLTYGEGLGIIYRDVFCAIASATDIIVFDTHESTLIVEVVIDILHVEVDGLYLTHEGTIY